MRLWVFDLDAALADGNRPGSEIDIFTWKTLVAEATGNPTDQVAVVSSRPIEDLKKLINIPDTVIGGYLGMEWLFPQGFRLGPFLEFKDALAGIREEMLPEFHHFFAQDDIKIRDRGWVIALETPTCAPIATAGIRQKLSA